MALTLDEDRWGRFAIVDCDAPLCSAHVAIRPGEDHQTVDDLIGMALDVALDEEWAIDGWTWCPRHARTRPTPRVERSRRPLPT